MITASGLVVSAIGLGVAYNAAWFTASAPRSWSSWARSSVTPPGPPSP